MIDNFLILIHNSLFKKHNFKSEGYEIRAINKILSQERTRYNLLLKDLEYDTNEEYISKEIKKKLAYSILKQICPLYDSLPFIPSLRDLNELKRLNCALEEKLNMFLINEEKAKDNNNNCYDNFFTKSFYELIDNDIFIQSPQKNTQSFHYTKKKSSICNNNNGNNSNDSLNEITRFIVSIQYTEDVKKIDQRKKSQVEMINTNKTKILEKYLSRQLTRKDTMKKTLKEVNATVQKEEIKYEQNIIKETEKDIRNKKFLQTRTFLFRFNQEAKKIKQQGRIFGKILSTVFDKKSKDYSNSNVLPLNFPSTELSSSPWSRIGNRKQVYTDNFGSDRFIGKAEHFNANLSLISMNNKIKYNEMKLPQRLHNKISLNKKTFKTPLSRNNHNHYCNTSLKMIISSTNHTMNKQTKPVIVFKRYRDNSQINNYNSYHYHNASNVVKLTVNHKKSNKR